MFSLSRLLTYEVPRQKLNLVHEVALSKGREQLFTHQNPESLKQLLDLAMIESIRASNVIEGVNVPKADELTKLIRNARWRPQNRDEEEVAAYRNALNYIYRPQTLKEELTSDLIIHLSRILWAHDPKKAGLKKQNNKVVLKFPDGRQISRFEPASAKTTPKLLKHSCKMYCKLIKTQTSIDHLVVAAFILDLLCIHPLEDGNGRLSRLINVFLLLQLGYSAVRYISHEGLIERDKDGYYEALSESFKGWQMGSNNIGPWINFSLGKLNLLYRSLERQLRILNKSYQFSLGSPDRTQAEVAIDLITTGQMFSRRDLEVRLGKTVSSRTIRRALYEAVKNGKLIREGAGSAIKYLKI